MLSKLGIDSPAVQYLIAFVIIFVLLGLFALVLRRITGGRLKLSSQERTRTRQPRLGIVDIHDLDRQRQLVLIRRDNVEHLLLLGGPNDVVVESHILRVPGARLPVVLEPQGGERPLPQEPAPERLPEPAPARPVLESIPSVKPEPVFKPIVEAPKPPEPFSFQREPAPAKPPEVMPKEVLPKEVMPKEREPIPQPEIKQPDAKPDKNREVSFDPFLVTEAPKEAFKPVAAPPPADKPKPAPARPEPPRFLSTLAKERAASKPAEAKPSSAPGKPVDQAALSDMARQLEQALKRPLSAMKAPAAAKSETLDKVIAPEPSVLAVKERPPLPEKPAAEAVPAASPPPSEPPPEPAKPAAIAPPAMPEAEESFSVDEIEAEFARLLGRPLAKESA